jgi:threonine dehydratase
VDAAVDLPTLDDVEDAARLLQGQAVETPLLRSPALDARCGGRLLFKAEVLQRTGSFKFRGAYNRLARIPEEDRGKGVVAWSSGNHAQGVAEAARVLGIPAAIVMPRDAPELKIRNTRALGAEIVFYDRETESREDIARALCRERGATLVPSFDDPHVIAGQGTLGLEVARQARALGQAVDLMLVPTSGGGLVTGAALGLHGTFPDAEVFTVEPAGFDDFARSLAGRARVRNARPSGSICDSLLAPTPGELTFPIALHELAGGVAVTDDEALAAVHAAFLHLKLVVEPSGACGLAAVLSGRLPVQNKTVVVVLSGGNVDEADFARALRTPDPTLPEVG